MALIFFTLAREWQYGFVDTYLPIEKGAIAVAITPFDFNGWETRIRTRVDCVRV